MFEAYVQLMNANYCSTGRVSRFDRGWNRVLRRMSEVLGDAFDYDSIARFVRRLRRDARSRRRARAASGRGRLVLRRALTRCTRCGLR